MRLKTNRLKRRHSRDNNHIKTSSTEGLNITLSSCEENGIIQKAVKVTRLSMLKKGSAKYLKYSLYFFNILYFIFGIGSIGVGLYIVVDETELSGLAAFDGNGASLDPLSNSIMVNCSVILVVTGSMLFIWSFIGCCATVREIKCLLAVYSAMLGVVFVLQLASLSLAEVMRRRFSEENLESALFNQLKTSYDNFYNSTDRFTKGYDYAMVYFECCGIRNYTEFKIKSMVPKWSHFDSQLVPAHCCKMDRTAFIDERIYRLNTPSCPTTLINSNIEKACFDEISSWLIKRAEILLSLSCVIVCIELIGLILAIILITCIQNDYSSKKVYKPK